MSAPRRAVVVGGGIAGLTAAYRLLRASEGRWEVALLEASSRPGGKIRTERVGDVSIEAGPDSFITAKPEALALVRELGLEGRLLPTDEKTKDVFVWSRGGLRKYPEGLMLMAPARVLPFLRSDLVSWPAKLRMGLDMVLPRGADADESLGAFARRRLGREALETIVDPVMAGIYAGDPDRLSLKATFPQFLDLERAHRSIILGLRKTAAKRPPARPGLTMFMALKGGLGELTEELAKRIGVSLKTGYKVERIMRENGRWVIKSGDGEKFADAVILACPASAASMMIERMDPDLGDDLRSIEYASTATLTLAYDPAGTRSVPAGFGFVVPRGAGLTVTAATFTSVKFPGRVPEGTYLIRTFLGGVGREACLSKSDEELAAAVRRDLELILGLRAEPRFWRAYRWPDANPQYNVGHEARVRRIEARAAAHPGLLLAGASYNGVGIPDCVRSGEAAAKAAAALLSA